jgi:hypothetical protein
VCDPIMRVQIMLKDATEREMLLAGRGYNFETYFY